MAEERNIRIEDCKGNIYYPHAKAKTTFLKNGKNVETELNEIAEKAAEAFQSANNGKDAVANAVTAKNVSASSTDTFSVLAKKIGQISTGKKWATGTGEFPSVTTFSITSLEFKPSVVYVLVNSRYGDNDVLVMTESTKNFIAKSNNYFAIKSFTLSNNGFTLVTGYHSSYYHLGKWFAIE